MKRQTVLEHCPGAMNDSEVRERPGRVNRAGGPVPDPVAAKLLRPLVRPGTVRRSALVERLTKGDARIVSVVAPPGYGKTTLLSQWAERNGQAFAWVSVDQGDNDPKVLLRDYRGSVEYGRADRQAGVRGAGLPGEFGARVGSPQARVGFLVDVLARGTGPG